jgi:hypothetical protein
VERLDASFENGKPATASELKTDERASMNNVWQRQAAGRVQDRDLLQRQNGSGLEASGSQSRRACLIQSRIRKAIDNAEETAWRTGFPHPFLPDLADEAIAFLDGSLDADVRRKTASFANAAEAQGLTHSKLLSQCHGSGFFSSVFWLLPQVCFLACS